MADPTREEMVNFLPIKEGTNYFTLKNDRVAYSCSAAKSFCIFDKTLYRGKLYRNLLDASVLGRFWAQGSTVTTFPAAQAPEGKDDRYNATVPHDEAFKDSLMIMFDSTDGTGNVVAMCKFKDFDQFSAGLPSRY